MPQDLRVDTQNLILSKKNVLYNIIFENQILKAKSKYTITSFIVAVMTQEDRSPFDFFNF